MTSPAPGWYPAPDGAPLQVWWDGQQWTSHTLPAPDPYQLQMMELARRQYEAQRRSSRSVESIRVLIVTVIVLAIVIYAVIRFDHNVNG